MGFSSFGLAFLAGVIGVLSPCILPLAPIVLGAAFSEHKFASAALALGIATSFSCIGLVLATVGVALDLDEDTIRYVGALFLAAFGVVLIIPSLQANVAFAGGNISNYLEANFRSQTTDGLGGQFAQGLLLGAVWGPCVGPTIGAASAMAMRGDNLSFAGAVMFAFGLGSALPLLLLGLMSREAVRRWRGRLYAIGNGGKFVLGFILVIMAFSVITGWERRIETLLLGLLPDAVIVFITRL